MIRLSLRGITIIGLSFMMIVGAFVCDENAYGMNLDYGKYIEDLKNFTHPQIQKQLRLLKDDPPDTIVTRVREELDGLHVEVDKYEEELDDVWDEVDDNTMEIRKLKRYIHDMELHKEGTKLQNEETTKGLLTGGGTFGGILLVLGTLFRSSLIIWFGTLPDKLINLVTHHKKKVATKKKRKKKT